MKHLLIAAAFALLASASYAEAQTTDDEWQFELTPYLWLAGITGDMVSEGVDLPPINPGYQFFSLENFDGVVFLTFMAEKKQWVIHSDLVYISFADTFQAGPVEASFDLSGGTAELSAGYRPNGWQNTNLIFGLRGVKANLDVALTPAPTGSDSRSFVDPIVGASHRRTFDNQWGLIARGDIGGTSSELMVNAMLAGTYQFTETFALAFGYRYLKIDFKESDFVIDLSIQGYSVGFQFDW
jgi:hypothetical protein